MQLNDLHAWVDGQKTVIEAALKQFVDMNTYTANTAGVDKGMDELSKLAQEMGFTIEAINGRHRLIKAGNEEAKPRILLISHMDTVFPPDGDFLAYEPLGDGFVRGPGTGDIKGGLIMGLWSMLALRELCDDFDVQMIVSADEENGSPTIREWYLGGHIGADYAIGLEPGFPQGALTPDVALGVVYQRRGYCMLEYTIHGKAAHSGTPHLGLSATEALAHRITRLHALNQPERGISVNVGTIQGGISPNTVAGTCTGTVSFRYERMADGEATRQAVEDVLKGQYIYNADLDLWDRAEYEVKIFIPPMERNEINQMLVDTVLAEAQRLKQNVVPIARGGGSDANWISAGGTPSICGMGAPTHGLHTTEEMIYLPGMFDRIELLSSVLYRLVAKS